MNLPDTRAAPGHRQVDAAGFEPAVCPFREDLRTIAAPLTTDLTERPYRRHPGQIWRPGRGEAVFRVA